MNVVKSKNKKTRRKAPTKRCFQAHDKMDARSPSHQTLLVLECGPLTVLRQLSGELSNPQIPLQLRAKAHSLEGWYRSPEAAKAAMREVGYQFRYVCRRIAIYDMFLETELELKNTDNFPLQARRI